MQAVVCATSKEEALKIHPSGNQSDFGETWTKCPEAMEIGVAYDGVSIGVVLADFNAG